jgi:hypothetical protein
VSTNPENPEPLSDAVGKLAGSEWTGHHQKIIVTSALVIGILLCVFLYYVVGWIWGSPESKIPVHDVGAVVETYRSNIIAAERKYTGKIIRIKGKVGLIQRISQRDTATVSVELRTSVRESRGLHALVAPSDQTRVTLLFRKEHEDAVARLSKGEGIVAQGKCCGFDPKGTIVLQDCVLIE